MPDLVRRELDNYLADAERDAYWDKPTRCDPWTVHDITRHLAATFARFNRMLAQGRAGDYSKPFERDELAEENLRAVAAFTGDPIAALRREVEAFVAAARDHEEVMPHQFGPIPVGLQMRFGLNELAVHHQDLIEALHDLGGGFWYEPDGDVIEALLPMYEALGHGRPAGTLYAWEWILMASGDRGW